MIWLLTFGGCLAPVSTVDQTCTSCHGDATSAAPPSALGGSTNTDDIGVGAHRAHIEGTQTGVAVACSECHQVPTAIDEVGHIDTPWPAEVIWGPLTKTGGITDATWDRETGTCSNTYCHGPGGTLTEPSWTVVDGSQIACGTCHGNPPADPHPQDSNCGSCHAPEGAAHINGVVDVEIGGAACAGCHGTGGTGADLAPPPDTTGSTDTTLRSVGAHAIHLTGGALSTGTACETCHIVPATVDDPNHMDGGLAEVVFSGLATGGVWDDEALTCTVYCHGDAEPVWTVVDGTEAACGSCHGVPPPLPHPQSSACSGCHSSAGPDQTIADPSQHCNGTVER